MNPRVAILAHSTNPRGGVVHAMQLAEALCAAGRDVTLLAPDVTGRGFFREPRCPTLLIPARPEADVAAMVRRRIGEVAEFLSAPGAPSFDVHHAQDPITANALADLSDAGLIDGFMRTVHHLDRFDDPQLDAWQTRGLRAADRVGVVSRLWQDRLRREYGLDPWLLGNGVDTAHFSPVPDGREAALRHRLGLDEAAPVVLAMGGIEARKNTLGTLQAFLRLRRTVPALRLVIAGGATLLDHAAYRAQVETVLRAAPDPDSVVLAGIVADADMPALYRIADVLCCASVAEGYGLCPLEALASGRPAVVSAIAPFTEHLGPDDVLWTDPSDPDAIARALEAALDPATSRSFRQRGPIVAQRFRWDRVAEAHGPFHRPARLPARSPEGMLHA